MEEVIDSWMEIMGKDIMLKKVKAGSGESASIGTVVSCNLTGYFIENELTHSSSPFEVLTDQQFKVGESDAFPGLELGLRHSKPGEIFHLRSASKFAFGQIGRPAIIVSTTSSGKSENGSDEGQKKDKSSISAIPPNTDLYYEVEVTKHQYEGEIDVDILRSIVKDDSEVVDVDLTGEQAIPEQHREEYRRRVAVRDISLRKDCGNRWFSYLDYARAAKAYSKGTQLADNYFKESPAAADTEGPQDSAVADKDLQVVHVYVACLNNLSACYLGMGESLKAKDMCVKVLEFDPLNVKALLRAAKATLALHDYKESEMCLNRVLQLDPANSAALNEMVRLRRAEKEYALRSKEMQRNMAKKLFPGTASTPSTAVKNELGDRSSAVESAATPVTLSKNNDEGGEVDSAVGAVSVDSAATADNRMSKLESSHDSVPSTSDSSATQNSPESGTTAGGGSAAVKSAASATAGTYIYNNSSNLVLLLATSLVVVVVSVYIALFAKY